MMRILLRAVPFGESISVPFPPCQGCPLLPSLHLKYISKYPLRAFCSGNLTSNSKNRQFLLRLPSVFQRSVLVTKNLEQPGRILGAFQTFKTKKYWIIQFMDFCIVLYFACHILGTTRATGDPVVSKLSDFLRLFRFYKK